MKDGRAVAGEERRENPPPSAPPLVVGLGCTLMNGPFRGSLSTENFDTYIHTVHPSLQSTVLFSGKQRKWLNPLSPLFFFAVLRSFATSTAATTLHFFASIDLPGFLHRILYDSRPFSHLASDLFSGASHSPRSHVMAGLTCGPVLEMFFFFVSLSLQVSGHSRVL